MAIQSIQQARARYALEQVETAEKALADQSQHNEYISYAAALPAMIHMNGLGQAAAFYRAKGGRHMDLYRLLSNWLCGNGKPYSEYSDLIKAITNEKSDMQQYKLAQAEAQALMDWVKKFAKAYMSEEKK